MTSTCKQSRWDNEKGRGKAKQMEIKFCFYFIQILKTTIKGYNQFAKV